MTTARREPGAAANPESESPAGGRRFGPDATGEVAWWRAAATLAVGIILALGLLGAIWVLARPLALLLVAIVLADALDPPVEWLARRLPRAAAVGLVYLLLVLAVGVLGWIVVPRLASQADEVAARAPELLARAEAWLAGWSPATARALPESIGSWVAGNAGALVELPHALVSGSLAAILVLVMSVYWSIAEPGLQRFSFTFVPPERRDEAAGIVRELVDTMGGYIRARAVVALVVAAVTYGGLLLIGVEPPLVLALLAGLGELVPFVGPVAAAIPALALAALVPPFPFNFLAVLALYVAVQQLKSHLLVPYLVRRQADIPPLLVIFAVLAGGSVGGIVGALVGPPLAGALRVLAVRVAVPIANRWWAARK